MDKLHSDSVVKTTSNVDAMLRAIGTRLSEVELMDVDFAMVMHNGTNLDFVFNTGHLRVVRSYAADVRAGRHRSHPRHWGELARLAGIQRNAEGENRDV